MIRDANQKFDIMKGSYCEWIVETDATHYVYWKGYFVILCFVLTQLKICWHVWKKFTFDDLL